MNFKIVRPFASKGGINTLCWRKVLQFLNLCIFKIKIYLVYTTNNISSSFNIYITLFIDAD